MPRKVADDESIARMLFSGKEHAKDKVKASAFIPPKRIKSKKDFQRSVHRVDGLSKMEILNIADKHVLPNRKKNNPKVRTHGYALIKEAKIIRDIELDVISDPCPHYRHALIVGWPESDKERQLQMAAELAMRSKLVLHPDYSR